MICDFCSMGDCISCLVGDEQVYFEGHPIWRVILRIVGVII